MEIKTTSQNSLLETLKTFAIGEQAVFTQRDFTLNDSNSYRAKIWRYKKFGHLPWDMAFKIFDLPNGGVCVTRMQDGKKTRS